MRHLLFTLVVPFTFFACGDSGSPLNPCPYSGASSDCATVAENTVGPGGVCEGEDTVSSSALEDTCNDLVEPYGDCWRACIEAAGSCDEALSCQDDCGYCG